MKLFSYAWRLAKLQWLVTGLAASCCLMGCSGSEDDDGADGIPIPIPDTFDVYFVAGSVCMPSNIQTGAAAPGYPVRFDVPIYRCINIDPSSLYLQTNFQCFGNICSMVMLARGRAIRDPSQTNCDGRLVPDPPAGQSTLQQFPFSNIAPPVLNGDFLSGPMQVTIPFLDLDQAQEVNTRVMAGENPQTVLLEVVGAPPANRQWTVNFDASYPAVTDAASLGGADCHAMPVP